ncbi:MAG: glycosyltransferase [Bacteroidota bacterium]|nr:glycosyltransferase [Bacteroidota bacterium]
MPATLKKKLLIVSTRLPYPLTDGVRIRIYNTAKYLSRHYIVDLACLTYQPFSASHLETLRGVFREVYVRKVHPAACALHALLSLWNRLPAQTNFFRFALFDRLLAEIAPRYDVVLFNHIRTSEYARRRHGKSILDLHDSFGLRYERTLRNVHGPMRWFIRFELSRVSAYEREVFDLVDHAVIVSEVDRRYLIERGAPAEKLSVLNVAVRDDIRPGPPADRGRCIVFLGRIAYGPNEDAVLWFADNVFPVVHARCPDTTFFIAGIDPTRRVLALRDRPGIVVTGYLENPYTLMNDATVVVAPIRFGAGMQNKVLEAMYLGKPVVVSTVGAEGIDGKKGEHFLIADDADTFARAVVELLEDRELASRIGEAGRKLVLERYTWPTAAERLIGIIETVLGAPPR